MDELIKRLRRKADSTVESPAPHLTGDMKFYVYDAETRELLSEAAAALEAAREDSARLDALDAMILDSTERALLLHHGLHKQREPSFCGLGLGNTGRTLRQAIDQARGKGGGEVEGG